VTVRPVRADEGAELRKLRLRALRSDPGAFATRYEDAREWPAERWAAWAEVILVADDWLGMVCGCLLDDPAGRRQASMAERASSAWLFALWVDPAARRRGLGAALVDALADWARGQGATALELSVTTNNPAAAALYARTGFTETGRRRPLPADPSRTEVFLRRDL
jgi:ribosomal protein S18 acetylase RimI-like enzyme